MTQNTRKRDKGFKIQTIFSLKEQGTAYPYGSCAFGARCFLNQSPFFLDPRVCTVVLFGVLSNRNMFKEASDVHSRNQGRVVQSPIKVTQG